MIEEELGRLFALAWLALFAYIAYLGVKPFFSGAAERQAQLAELQRDPITIIAVGIMVVGLSLFLFWIVAGGTPIGIDRTRVAGVPLGLGGFGAACIALVVLWSRSGR